MYEPLTYGLALYNVTAMGFWLRGWFEDRRYRFCDGS